MGPDARAEPGLGPRPGGGYERRYPASGTAPNPDCEKGNGCRRPFPTSRPRAKSYENVSFTGRCSEIKGHNVCNSLPKNMCAHAHVEQRGTMSRTSWWLSSGPTAGRDESNGPSALGSLRRRCEVPGGPERPPAGPCCSSKVEGTEPRGPPPASMVRCEVLRLAHLSHHVQRTKRSSRRACGGDATPSPAATGERAEFRQGYAAFKGQGASRRPRWNRIRTNTLYPSRPKRGRSANGTASPGQRRGLGATWAHPVRVRAYQLLGVIRTHPESEKRHSLSAGLKP